MKKVISKLSKLGNIRLTLNQWYLLKYACWILLNAYLWYKNYPLLDAVIINIIIYIVTLCTKVHAVAMGLFMNPINNINTREVEDDPSYIFMEPPDKDKLN